MSLVLIGMNPLANNQPALTKFEDVKLWYCIGYPIKWHQKCWIIIIVSYPSCSGTAGKKWWEISQVLQRTEDNMLKAKLLPKKEQQKRN